MDISPESYILNIYQGPEVSLTLNVDRMNLNMHWSESVHGGE